MVFEKIAAAPVAGAASSNSGVGVERHRPRRPEIQCGGGRERRRRPGEEVLDGGLGFRDRRRHFGGGAAPRRHSSEAGTNPPIVPPPRSSPDSTRSPRRRGRADRPSQPLEKAATASIWFCVLLVMNISPMETPEVPVVQRVLATASGGGPSPWHSARRRVSLRL